MLRPPTSDRDGRDIERLSEVVIRRAATAEGMRESRLADDMTTIADALGYREFGVTGWSEGGGWALAAAAYIDPARLRHVTSIAGASFVDRAGTAMRSRNLTPRRTNVSLQRSLLFAFLLAPIALPALAESGDFTGLVAIGGGRSMYLECRGTGSPTVFIVPGGKAAADDWTESEPGKMNVFSEVAKFTRVCTYDRPGTPLGNGRPSRSDPVPMPITVADSVADLYALVAAAGVETPFVIVGHSYGGLIVRLYAMTYPGDVDGMVLVDALSEGLRAAETPEEWVNQKIILDGGLTEALKDYPEIERADADASFDQLLAAPPLQPMPLAVLSADHPWGPLVPGFIAEGMLPADIPPDVGYVTDRAQKEAQANLAALVPGSKHVVNTDSGHEIHKDQPQLVLASIREVVDALRAGKTALEP